MQPRGLDPIYTSRDARAAGLTRGQRKADGRRITRGAYLSSALPLNLLDAGLAALSVSPPGAALSHRTAAAALGAPVPAAFPIEITVPPGTYRPRRGRIRVRVRALRPADRITYRGVPMTSGSQTWLDLAAELPAEELVAVGDWLYRSEHLDAQRLGERLARADGARGVVLARRCGSLLTPLAASRPESLLRYWLVDSDLPDPQVQLPIRDALGRVVAHADLGYEAWKVAIEYEGRQHAEAPQFGRDLTRYSLMASTGWVTLRFGAADLYRRHTVVERVAGALHSRGARW